MPIRKNNQRSFHRCLYSGELQTITLNKRGDDQQEGTITAYVLYQCRRADITRTGEPIQRDMDVNMICWWMIPVIELNRVGIPYINAVDTIIDEKGRMWAPLASDTIEVKLFENYVRFQTKRLR